jgi:hypothetical protein
MADAEVLELIPQPEPPMANLFADAVAENLQLPILLPQDDFLHLEITAEDLMNDAEMAEF